MSWVLFVLLAAALVAHAFWIYLRVDLGVAGARTLATLRSLALIVVLALLFDVRLPVDGVAGAPSRWVLLDASLSMGALSEDGASPWVEASQRARAMSGSGWNVVTFGADPPRSSAGDTVPGEPGTLLVPALQRAAEGGAREVLVLSDQRFEDGVAIRAALESLPLDVAFERFGGAVANAAVTALRVPDMPRPDAQVTAEVELHGAGLGDSLTVELLEEGEVVSTTRVPAPAPGLRSTVTVDVPPPGEDRERVRYTARIRAPDDGFAGDDQAVDYAAVGREEGALVVVSLVPDWEIRFLLPALGEVTGLPTVGYVRAGPDRFVVAGRAIERRPPVDSTTVRRAVDAATLIVLHGVGAGLDDWATSLVGRGGRRIVMPRDPAGAAAAGVTVGAPRPGEWYVSADVPTSPIAGALIGAELQALPPLTDVMSTPEATADGPLLLQLRGAGPPAPALRLEESAGGRTAVTLASGYWRWAARDVGRDAYRRLWSGVAGWLLADRSVVSAEARPERWVFERGESVGWRMPVTDSMARVVVSAGDTVVVDTVLTGTSGSLGVLPPGPYGYRVVGATGDTIGAGRFDVSAATAEMLPLPDTPPAAVQRAGVVAERGGGRPLRTLPWPYLLVIALLCAEWIGRRRSGLR